MALVVVAAGCGSDDEARSERAPARADQHLGQIGEEGITASPDKFGAGPITLLVANQSGRLADPHDRRPPPAPLGRPDQPEDTATVRLRVQPGEHTVSAEESAGLRAATLTVGPQRASAQNDLLLP